MSIFSDWLNPGKAYRDAQNTLNQGYDKAQGYQQPFYQGGVDAGGTLSEQLKRLMNPQGLQDEWNKSYETSDAAKQDIAQANEQGMGAASSMGLMGSTTAMQGIQSGAHNIMSHDRQQYLDNLMQKYSAGLGLGQNMYGIGAQAGGQMGDRTYGNAQDMGTLGVGASQAGANRFGDILSTIGSAGTSYLTGGMGTGGMGRGMWGK